jgi:hypothetical protein
VNIKFGIAGSAVVLPASAVPSEELDRRIGMPVASL